MSAYTKLFASILDSTVWRLGDGERIVWITMLAMADRDGVVEASVPGLADRARVQRAVCERALAVLSAPDPDSRTKSDDGRRIREVDGGWAIINYEKHRDRMTAEDIRAKAAERQRRKRARAVTPVTPVSRPVTPVTPVTPGHDMQRHRQMQRQRQGESAGAPETPTPAEPPATSPEALAVVAELEHARDLWPALTPQAVGAVARRIADAVAREPTAARCGLTAAVATVEAVAQSRTYLAAHPMATQEQVLAEVERVVVRYILGDCRKGNRRPVVAASAAIDEEAAALAEVAARAAKIARDHERLGL